MLSKYDKQFLSFLMLFLFVQEKEETPRGNWNKSNRQYLFLETPTFFSACFKDDHNKALMTTKDYEDTADYSTIHDWSLFSFKHPGWNEHKFHKNLTLLYWIFCHIFVDVALVVSERRKFKGTEKESHYLTTWTAALQ